MATFQEILFVDASLTDLSTILSALSPDIEIVRLDKNSDGLTQIDQYLQGRSGVTAIHIVSHGASGQLTIGSSVIDAATLSGQAATLASIGSYLSADADILLYGCDIADGSDGLAFINALAAATGADVAASTDDTGAAALGGDWVLEAGTGVIEAPSLSAESMPGVLAAPALSGLDSSFTYVENAAAVTVDSNMAYSGGSSYGGGYIRFAVGSSNANDIFALTSAASVNASGAISISGSTVYLGNGSIRESIGSVDSTENGLNGQALKINFSANFLNPSFEVGSATGWTVVSSQVKLGTTVINGNTTPSDPTYATNSGGDADTGSFTYSSQTVSGGASDGTYSLRLYNSGTTANGYDVVHGPAAYSNTFTASANDVLYFDWKAVGGSDAFDAFGYLMKADGSNSIIVLNRTGASASVTTAWATASVTVPSSGDWYFVFVSGTWDATGGRAAGGSLYIDNFKVYGNKVTDAVATSIVRQVTYQNSAEDAPTSRTVTISSADGLGATSSATSTLSITNANDAPQFHRQWHLGCGQRRHFGAGGGIGVLTAHLQRSGQHLHSYRYICRHCHRWR